MVEELFLHFPLFDVFDDFVIMSSFYYFHLVFDSTEFLLHGY
jgi:hypothetical protein